MFKWRKLTALSLLGIFGLVLLHQLVPHDHHSHAHFSNPHQTEHHHSEHPHNHNYNHDGKHSHDNNNKGGTLLGFLLKGHVHSYHTGNTPILVKIVTPQIKAKYLFSLSALPGLLKFEIPPIRNEKNFNHHSPPDYYNPICLSGYSLRGPPRLG